MGKKHTGKDKQRRVLVTQGSDEEQDAGAARDMVTEPQAQQDASVNRRVHYFHNAAKPDDHMESTVPGEHDFPAAAAAAAEQPAAHSDDFARAEHSNPVTASEPSSPHLPPKKNHRKPSTARKLTSPTGDNTCCGMDIDYQNTEVQHEADRIISPVDAKEFTKLAPGGSAGVTHCKDENDDAAAQDGDGGAAWDDDDDQQEVPSIIKRSKKPGKFEKMSSTKPEFKAKRGKEDGSMRGASSDQQHMTSKTKDPKAHNRMEVDESPDAPGIEENGTGSHQGLAASEYEAAATAPQPRSTKAARSNNPQGGASTAQQVNKLQRSESAKGGGAEREAATPVKAPEHSYAAAAVGSPDKQLDREHLLHLHLKQAFSDVGKKQKEMDDAAVRLKSIVEEWGDEDMTVEKLKDTMVGKTMQNISSRLRNILTCHQAVVRTIMSIQESATELTSKWKDSLVSQGASARQQEGKGSAGEERQHADNAGHGIDNQLPKVAEGTGAGRVSTHNGGRPCPGETPDNADVKMEADAEGSSHAAKAKPVLTEATGNGKLHVGQGTAINHAAGHPGVVKSEGGQSDTGVPSTQQTKASHFLSLLASLAANGQPLPVLKTGDATRDKALAMLTVCLTPIFPVAPATLAGNIERALLKVHGQDGLPSLAYKVRLKQLWALLGPESSIGHQLRQLLLAGCLVPEQVVTLAEEDLVHKAVHQEQQASQAMKMLLVGRSTSDKYVQVDTALHDMRPTCTSRPQTLTKPSDRTPSGITDSSQHGKEQPSRTPGKTPGADYRTRERVGRDGWESGSKRSYRQLVGQDDTPSRGSDPVVNAEPPAKVPRSDAASPAATAGHTPGSAVAVGKAARWDVAAEPQHTPAAAKTTLPADATPAVSTHYAPAVTATTPREGRDASLVGSTGAPSTASAAHRPRTPAGFSAPGDHSAPAGVPSRITAAAAIMQGPEHRPDGPASSSAAIDDAAMQAGAAQSHSAHPADSRGREMTHGYASKDGSRSYGHDKDGFARGKGDRPRGEHSGGWGPPHHAVGREDSARAGSHAEAGTVDHPPTWTQSQHHPPYSGGMTPGDGSYPPRGHHPDGHRDAPSYGGGGGTGNDYPRRHDYHPPGEGHTRYGYERDGGRGGYGGGRHPRRGGYYSRPGSRGETRDHTSYPAYAYDPRSHTPAYAAYSDAAAHQHGTTAYAAGPRADELPPHAYPPHNTVVLAIGPDGVPARVVHPPLSAHRPVAVSVPPSNTWQSADLIHTLPPPRATPGQHGPMRRSEDVPSPATCNPSGGTIPGPHPPPIPPSGPPQHNTPPVPNQPPTAHAPPSVTPLIVSSSSVPRASSRGTQPTPSPRGPLYTHHAAHPSPSSHPAQHSKPPLTAAYSLSPHDRSVQDSHAGYPSRRSDSSHQEALPPATAVAISPSMSQLRGSDHLSSASPGALPSSMSRSSHPSHKPIAATPHHLLGVPGPPPPPVPPRSNATLPLVPSQAASTHQP